MKKEKDDLLREVLSEESEPAPAASSTALVRTVRGKPAVVTNLEALDSLIPEEPNDELRNLLNLALLGVCVGFSDRHLSPYMAEHVAIIGPLLDDIRAVFLQLQSQGAAYDPEDFCYRAYDYGIHKAYYLDWQLYLSKDLY